MLACVIWLEMTRMKNGGDYSRVERPDKASILEGLRHSRVGVPPRCGRYQELARAEIQGKRIYATVMR